MQHLLRLWILLLHPRASTWSLVASIWSLVASIWSLVASIWSRVASIWSLLASIWSLVASILYFEILITKGEVCAIESGGFGIVNGLDFPDDGGIHENLRVPLQCHPAGNKVLLRGY